MRIFFFIFFGFPVSLFAQNIVSGYIKDSLSAEPLIGVNIVAKGESRGATTNQYGFFSFSMGQATKTKVLISYIGYNKKEIEIIVSKEPIELLLSSSDFELNEIKIIGNSIEASPEIGQIRIGTLQIKSTPALLGEKDAIKILQLLPGVQKGVEGSTSLFVRGGGSDQNLMLLDDAVVYNANHFFGLFSVFNSDAIKDVLFQKGGFSAKYGGRTSSVIDIQMKEGNRKQISGEGGIGLISSRFLLEGPIKKDKASFMISGRRTYFDPILKLIQGSNNYTRYRFYDLNAKINWDLNKKNKLFLSGFQGDDAFNSFSKRFTDVGTSETTSSLQWGNATSTARWTHLFSQRLFLNAIVALTEFKSAITEDNKTILKVDNFTSKTQISFGSSIRDYSSKVNLEYLLNPKIVMQSGVFVSRRLFNPKIFSAKNSQEPQKDTLGNQNTKNIEAGAYISYSYKSKEKVNLTAGFRYVVFQVEQKSFYFAEPRLNFSYEIRKNQYLKISYARMSQGVNLLSSTGFGLSTDLWVPATTKFKPQTSDNVSLGFERNFLDKKVTFSWEVYGKSQRNILSFKEGASFIAIGENPELFDWQNNVVTGDGVAYGNEFLIRKNTGRLNGWLSYTYAKAIHRFENLNLGKPFSPFQDRRHDVSLVGSYNITKRLKFATTWIFTSGNPVTLPIGFYQEQKGKNDFFPVNYYAGKNGARFPDYHRLDLSITKEMKNRNKRFKSNWEFGLFNAYFRKNPFDAFVKINNTRQGSTLSIEYSYLLPIVPSINYNFKF